MVEAPQGVLDKWTKRRRNYSVVVGENVLKFQAVDVGCLEAGTYEILPSQILIASAFRGHFIHDV